MSATVNQKPSDKSEGAAGIGCTDGLGIVIQTLNEAFEADPNAINALITMRVPCNQKLADHPTIQVGGNPDVVGMLGVINGIVERLTGKRVAAIYGDDSKLEGFTEYRNQYRRKDA